MGGGSPRTRGRRAHVQHGVVGEVFGLESAIVLAAAGFVVQAVVLMVSAVPRLELT